MPKFDFQKRDPFNATMLQAPGAVEPLRFDYTLLDEEVRAEVMAAAREIRVRETKASENLVAIGRRLLAVKALTKGHFTAWVEAEFDYGTTMARQLMAVAERFGDDATLSVVFSSTALRLLSTSFVADEEIVELAERAKAEERLVTVAEAKAVVVRAHTRARASKHSGSFRVDNGNAPAVAVSSLLDMAAAVGGAGAGNGDGASLVGVSGMNTRNDEEQSAPPRTHTRVGVELDVDLRDLLVEALRHGSLAGFLTNRQRVRLLEQLGA